MVALDIYGCHARGGVEVGEPWSLLASQSSWSENRERPCHKHSVGSDEEDSWWQWPPCVCTEVLVVWRRSSVCYAYTEASLQSQISLTKNMKF